ncbi:hypothetical protein ARMSODRAFT_967891 [Armillaria solidipes]|uniref:Uncharacterized protein n=1 Tax=Armillaria solidipes TaxID=1076256 RepID=A0A2H3AWS2_9AGAR|nr:hypothetical protein ARMSODRAFT_967891 [Armillaria solidipes]
MIQHTTRSPTVTGSSNVLNRKSSCQEFIGPGYRRVEIMTSTCFLDRSPMLVCDCIYLNSNANRSLGHRNEEETSRERRFPSASVINRFMLRIRCHDVPRHSNGTRNMRETSVQNIRYSKLLG